jgi:hypothetical protein
MSGHPEPSRLATALFWRWLLAGALVFAAVAQLEVAATLRLIADARLDRGAIEVGGARIALASLVSGLAVAAAYALYAVVFLANYFFFQGFERLSGRRLASLWLLASLRLTAGVLAAWLLRVIVIALATPVADGDPVMSGMILGAIEAVLNAATGAGFGFLLWSLQHDHSVLLAGRAPLLRRAHVLGGAAGGAVLALAALALLRYPVPAGASPAALALAVLPHLILTWRAMRRALVEDVRDAAAGGAFVARLLATLAFFAVAGFFVFLLSVR